MEYITTTQLRTKSSRLVSDLKKGKKLSLMHRSQVIGEITPISSSVEKVIFDVKKFKEAMKALKPKKLIPREDRDKIYRKHLMEKYGKGLPRR